jgi:hypothetical protein
LRPRSFPETTRSRQMVVAVAVAAVAVAAVAAVVVAT